MKDKIWLSPGGGKYGENLPSGELERVYIDKKLSYHSGLDVLDHKDQSVTADKIQNSAVTTQKLQSESVTAPKLASNAVTTEKIAGGAVSLEKLATAVRDYFVKKSGDIINGTLEVLSVLKAATLIRIGTGVPSENPNLELTKNTVSVTKGDLTITAPNRVVVPNAAIFGNDMIVAGGVNAGRMATDSISSAGDVLNIDAGAEIYFGKDIHTQDILLGGSIRSSGISTIDMPEGYITTKRINAYGNARFYENVDISYGLFAGEAQIGQIDATALSVTDQLVYMGKDIRRTLGTYPVQAVTGATYSGGIYPNVKYDFGTKTQITVTDFIAPYYPDITNEYVFWFTSAEPATTLLLPASPAVKWSNGTAPIIRSGRTYEISIAGGLGVWIEYA